MTASGFFQLCPFYKRIPFLEVVVTVSLDKYGAFLDAATVYDYFTRFITEILLLEEVDAPSAKRKRLMEGSVCQSMDEDTVVDAAKPSSFCGARNVQYKAVFETWIGRRQMKRKIPPSSVTSPLQMEKLVLLFLGGDILNCSKK